MLRPEVNNLKVLLLAFLIVVVTACDGIDVIGSDREPRFDHHGLHGHVVNRLYTYDNRILAGTDQGLYLKAADSDWTMTALPAGEVLDIALIGAGHYLVSLRESDQGIFNDRLMETTDGGETWQSVEHNFGGEEAAQAIYGLYYDSYNNALYATGVQVLAASYDNGRSWEVLSGEWDAFGQRNSIVRHNPATNEIWYGGQNAIEQMVLERYSLDTQDLERFPDLLPSPAVIYGIQFDPNNDLGVYVSGEGGILKTEDNGEQWRTLIGDVDYRFYFDLALDPNDPQTLYTGGWDKGWDDPQPLIFEISRDDGHSWEQYEYPSDDLFGGVRSILATTEDNTTVVYLGLYGGGIMKVTFP